MIGFMFPYAHKGHGLVVRKERQFQLLLMDMHYHAYFIIGPQPCPFADMSSLLLLKW